MAKQAAILPATFSPLVLPFFFVFVLLKNKGRNVASQKACFLRLSIDGAVMSSFLLNGLSLVSDHCTDQILL